MYPYFFHHRQHPAPSVQPAQPQVTYPDLASSLQYLASLVTQAYAPTGTGTALNTVYNTRQDFIALYEQNWNLWQQMLLTPVTDLVKPGVTLSDAIASREAANRYYQQWDTYSKYKIREAEATLQQFGYAVAPYTFQG